MLHERARAKINLYLHVGGRRADGYHALQSLVCFTDAGDGLEFERAPGLHLELDGPFCPELDNNNDNLVLRAARALAHTAGRSLGARIRLTKALPVASGIGGGSADAAAALRGLSRLWELALEPSQLERVALELGSDVPVCLLSQPAQMSGRGELVDKIEGLPQLPMLLVNPRIAVSTAAVFRHLGRSVDDPPPDAMAWPGSLTARELVVWLKGARNDMQDAACSIAPEIGEVLVLLERAGALITRMCGSGATCYGLFDDAASCELAARTIASAQPKWWVCPTRIAGYV
jgi:4-diphosphocytidyl-2-C-methyl-D-erythritol kinase